MCLTHITCCIHLKKCTLSVSVGVNGTVNGRSASSPTGNSALSNSSLPAKGNKEKTKANCSLSQKSSQDKGQLHQKTIQKTKEKVNICLLFIYFLSFAIHCMKAHCTVLLYIPGTPSPVIRTFGLFVFNYYSETQQKTTRDIEHEWQPVGILVR